jgi:hypothetical protein
MMFLLFLPMSGYLGMIVLLATYGEIIVNKNGFEEWLVVMGALVIIRTIAWLRRCRSESHGGVAR